MNIKFILRVPADILSIQHKKCGTCRYLIISEKLIRGTAVTTKSYADLICGSKLNYVLTGYVPSINCENYKFIRQYKELK